MRAGRIRRACAWVGVVLLILLSGCDQRFGVSGYGEIKTSAEATASFQNYEMKPNFTYYTSGSPSFPNAMIAIDNRYTLVSQLWKQRDFTKDELKDIVQNMQAKADEYGLLQFGFDIVDDQGNDVGDWYSILWARTSVKVEDAKVFIKTPPMDTYERSPIRRYSPE